MAPKVHPKIVEYLEWRSQFHWAEYLPIDMEKAAKMPPSVMYFTDAMESILRRKVDPTQGYWMMDTWLSSPYVEPSKFVPFLLWWKKGGRRVLLICSSGAS